MSRRAVVIGCDYPGTVAEMQGCVNDAYLTAELLIERLSFPKECVVFLTDRNRKTMERNTDPKSSPSKKNILTAIDWLVSMSGPRDCLFFSFAGIGTQTQRESNPEEEDLMRESLCPTDFDEPDEDAFPYRLIHDIEFQTLMCRLHPQAQLVLLLDCNHAGTMLPVTHKVDATLDKKVKMKKPVGFWSRARNPATWNANRIQCRPRFLPALPLVKKMKDEVPRAPGAVYPGLHPKTAAFAFSAARDDQAALEACLGDSPLETTGLLTYSFHQALAALATQPAPITMKILFDKMNQYLALARVDAALRYANQHIQFAFPSEVDPDQYHFY
eukprot:Platyproteum_vivax@DN5302_c0_g1_i1.p1